MPVQFPLFSTPHQKATSLRGVAINARPNSCSMKNGHKQSHPARSPHFVQKYRANVSASGRSYRTRRMCIMAQGFARSEPRFRTTLSASEHADLFRRTRCPCWWVTGAPTLVTDVGEESLGPQLAASFPTGHRPGNTVFAALARRYYIIQKLVSVFLTAFTVQPRSHGL
jgi:hypothetical protein